MMRTNSGVVKNRQKRNSAEGILVLLIAMAFLWIAVSGATSLYQYWVS